jgi:hypothetical protein
MSNHRGTIAYITVSRRRYGASVTRRSSRARRVRVASSAPAREDPCAIVRVECARETGWSLVWCSERLARIGPTHICGI